MKTVYEKFKLGFMSDAKLRNCVQGLRWIRNTLTYA